MFAQRSKSSRLARIIAVIGVALGTLAAPASAADRETRVPEARGFTQLLPEATQLRGRSPAAARIAERRNGYGLEGPLLYRTPVVEAPRPFDLVGVAGETHALEYRSRDEGGVWSDWAEADNGDPVYTGGAEQVQVRSRGVPIEGRLHYIAVDGGSAPAATPRGPERRRSGAERRVSTPKPTFISRSAWGANGKKGGCTPRENPDFGRVKAAVVHHTVSTNGYSEAQAPGLVLGICQYHRDANGWNDIGYNAVVDRFGNLYEGRAGGVDRAVVGAQTEGHNLQTAGVAVIGDRSSDAPAGPERKTLIRYLAWRLDVAGIDAAGEVTLTSSGGSSNRTPEGKRIRVNRILSHSDTNFTECAGTKLRDEIPKIRRAVQRRIKESAEVDPAEPPDPVAPANGGALPRP